MCFPISMAAKWSSSYLVTSTWQITLIKCEQRITGFCLSAYRRLGTSFRHWEFIFTNRKHKTETLQLFKKKTVSCDPDNELRHRSLSVVLLKAGCFPSFTHETNTKNHLLSKKKKKKPKTIFLWQLSGLWCHQMRGKTALIMWAIGDNHVL